MENLIGDGNSKVSEKAILEDIARTIYVAKKRPLTKEELQSPSVTNKEYAKAETQTWTKIYPYTRPLLATRLRKKIGDHGFKERWSQEKIEIEIRQAIDASEEKYVTQKQCFAVEINTPELEALELKYWYGTLKQGGREQALMFSKGGGFTVVTTNVTVGQTTAYTTNTREHFFYADACGTKPIQLGEEFAISIEPRYEQGLLPLELKWLPPKM